MNWIQYFKQMVGLGGWTVVEKGRVYRWKSGWSEVLYYFENGGIVREQVKGAVPITMRGRKKIIYDEGSWKYKVYMRQFADLDEGIYKPTSWYEDNQ